MAKKEIIINLNLLSNANGHAINIMINNILYIFNEFNLYNTEDYYNKFVNIIKKKIPEINNESFDIINNLVNKLCNDTIENKKIKKIIEHVDNVMASINIYFLNPFFKEFYEQRIKNCLIKKLKELIEIYNKIKKNKKNKTRIIKFAKNYDLVEYIDEYSIFTKSDESKSSELKLVQRGGYIRYKINY